MTNFSDSLGETASYSYYSDGLRASKTIGSNTTKYYYDGDNAINETLNGNGYATNVLGADGYTSRRQDGTTGYLFKNAHGDVVSAHSSTTNKIADYAYDAWGEQRTTGTQVWGASNPIRYNGQYYDTESGMTYLRARYYDSDIKRFISEDPIKDGLNWYSYCENNPVMYIDPSGLLIYVPYDQQTILDQLNVISRDELDIDGNGYVYIKNQNMNADDRPWGTDLIYQMIEEDNTCLIRLRNPDVDDYKNGTIIYDKQAASKKGEGCDVEVYFESEYNKQDVVFVENDYGEIVKERQPTYLALGHELVHSLRSMKGNRKRDSLYGWNDMYGGDREYMRQEELDTVGLNHYRNDEKQSYANAYDWAFTENTLRRELGHCIRVRYRGW